VNRRSHIGSLVAQIHEDWIVHSSDWTLPGFRALAVHRYGNWVMDRCPGMLRSILFGLYRIMYRYVRNYYGIELPRTTRIGRRFLLGHQSGIVIHWNAVFGDDCMIRQNVTVGAITPERGAEAPKFGDRVQIGAGAVILGPISVGDGVRIGPNAVVMTNVPAGATVFAAPSRIIQLPNSCEPKTEAAPGRGQAQTTETVTAR
jgi:serine O-acetyltransferase